MNEIAIHWFRRDLRIQDNTALFHALDCGLPVLPLFIFDHNIIDELVEDDARITFIFQQLEKINLQLKKNSSGILVLKGEPVRVWKELIKRYEVKAVYWNKDYEPYAIERDNSVRTILEEQGVYIHTFKDQVIFEENEVIKDDGKPYTVFTPYKKRWLERFAQQGAPSKKGINWKKFYPHTIQFPTLASTGFRKSSISVKPYDLSRIDEYDDTRNIPAEDCTSYLGPHLRFGTVSIRQIIKQFKKISSVFISELIWREFFMQILYHFPEVVNENFRTRYNGIRWRNDESEFERWCNGTTGFPLVDAGMRQLNESGYMHNRVRMVAASFLCKHLLIDWRWGEAYFATRLLDYELSSNNGNWQWAAGTGCDAAPYFRIFNPDEQQKKFDREFLYIKKWIPEFGSKEYPDPIIDHKQARERALETYKSGILVKLNHQHMSPGKRH